MSERENVEKQLVTFLEKNDAIFNAPYGILTGMQTLRSGGKVRTITFGVARYLDASIWIYSPNRITVWGRGGLTSRIEGHYNNVNQVLEKLKTFIH